MSDGFVRQTWVLRAGWRFLRGDHKNGAASGCDDSSWERVRVPHDWAIDGPFQRDHDLQHLRIFEDGDMRSIDHSGRTGGLPHVGVAWYRRPLEDIDVQAGEGRYRLEFDGVMSHSRVFVNGRDVGGWPYGYASFAFDVTDALNPGKGNVVAVRVDNKPCASRWYPGAGIYRNVRLVRLGPVHVGHWGTAVETPGVTADSATVRVCTRLVDTRATREAGAVELETVVLGPDGQPVTRAVVSSVKDGETCFDQRLVVPSPQLWDTANPVLYRVLSLVRCGGRECDRYETRFGIRTIAFDAARGFALNGTRTRFNGVCMHHDLGALGTAVNRRAMERQLEILAEMGCNAIRTSHNPPAPEWLDLCDEKGFLVIDEAFDEWKKGKVDNGYHTLFDEWAERDLRAMIRRDRNHPCVVLWSIGNEIGEQSEPNGAELTTFLTEICHDEDPTRPVTAGMNSPDGAIENGFAEALDVQGWNYKPQRYAEYCRDHPGWVMYGSETASCVSSRGEYYFPVEEERGKMRPSLQVTSYDVSAPGWGYSPDYEFAALDDCPAVMGEFVWTGFDYLGEPTPYKTEWPSRSAYFGIVDLCGIPKDRYYLYRSKWQCGSPTLHVLPHWTWPDRVGETTPVHVYTSFPEAELFLNGRSLGRRSKDQSGVMRRYRIAWDDVVYEPGELKVVAYGDDHQPAAERVVRTAGPATRLVLSADRPRIFADGDDLCFVRVDVLDAEGTICPLADDVVSVSVEGCLDVVAVDNGDPTSLEPFRARKRRAFHGQCMIVLRSREAETGDGVVRVSAAGLEGADLRVAVASPVPAEEVGVRKETR